MVQQTEVAMPTPDRAARAQGLPLSFTQERLWLLDQWQPAGATYHRVTALRLSGPLNREALAWSLSELTDRHEAWRTTIDEQNGQPRQRVAPALALELTQLEVDESLLEGMLKADAQRPFDLRRGPLVRLTLLRLGADDHVLLVVAHEIVSDGHSSHVLVDELIRLYGARLAGQPSPLGPLPLQLADYALRQREHLQGSRFDRHLTYWTERLQGAAALLELPTDRPRQAIQTTHGARGRLELAVSLKSGLEELSRALDVTLFMTVLAGFQAVLARYTEQTDLVIGIENPARTEAGTEHLIGCLADTMVVRSDLSGDPSFRELVHRVNDAVRQSETHAEVPFARLVEAVQPTRNLSYTPIFQVLVAQRTASEPTTVGGVTFEPIDVDNGTSRYDLTLNLVEARHGLAWVLEYNTDLFDGATAGRLLGHLETL
ncbi:MAG: condensation domain-containing protein, partial [Acidobacteria bacterium]|nr:condensation domain-containing protein [Acidobacteriota bacterium]